VEILKAFPSRRKLLSPLAAIPPLVIYALLILGLAVRKFSKRLM
jgi:hypothetical protein